MAETTTIEWTDATWNPITGCTEVSPGCDHCYAKTFAERFRGVPGHHFEQGFDVVLRPERLDQPLRWKKPKRVFVNSMSDLFHDSIPDEYIHQVFDVMENAKHHTFQVLTKRHSRMRSFVRARMAQKREYADKFALCPTEAMRTSPAAQWARHRAENPPANIWLGVSVENQQWADIRIPALLGTPAVVRFLSMEPLLGPVDLTHMDVESRANEGMYWINALTGENRDMGRPCQDVSSIDWVIVGGESGRGARPMRPSWARSLRDQCTAAGVPFHFKQWGAYGPANATDNPDQMLKMSKKAAGRELDGRTWDEFPATTKEHDA